MIDDEDYERVNQYKWYANNYAHPYAIKDKVSQGVKTTTLLHRFLMNPPDDMVVDHIDGNTLNNQKANLRVIPQKLNSRHHRVNKKNTSGYNNVRASGRRWKAYIKVNYRQINLGVYDTPEEAFKASELYNKKLWEQAGYKYIPHKKRNKA